MICFYFPIIVDLASGEHKPHIIVCVGVHEPAHVPHVIQCSVAFLCRLLGNLL